MTVKTAVWIAGVLVGAALLYSFVYLSYSDTGTLVATPTIAPATPPNPEEGKTSKAAEIPAEFKAPATPDTAVDDLIDESLNDRDDLDAEVQGELSDLEINTSNINNLSEVYDDKEIQ